MEKNSKQKLEKIMETIPVLREKLFARGFLFTDAEVDEKEYPFYGLWNKVQIGKYCLLVSPKQHFYVRIRDEKAMILVGHAYNPFSMCAKEDSILGSLLEKGFGETLFWEELNELTGVFTLIYMDSAGKYIVGDSTCMQTVFYSQKEGHTYISSHTNLLGDLLGLHWDPYVKELSEYRFFPMLGNELPGDITQFQEVKRLVPNHYVKFGKSGIEKKRFYFPHTLSMNQENVVEQAAAILHRNLELISAKWNKPAISMTGGCDSKTTLACATGLYDKFSYFSYTSSESENVDAKAAHQICEALQLNHQIYEIPQEDTAFSNIEEIRTILEWNTGDIIPVNRNDVRKRAFFTDSEDFDVEVKSWASEIGRAYYSKRFHGRKNFGKKPTPRKCTTVYKFFLHNRKLVKQTDEIFKKYLKEYFQQTEKNPVEWQEQLFWEYRVPSWNGLVITGEHRYSFDITIPYNNRRLLELLLSVPMEDRIQDKIYRRIREQMNPTIDRTGIAVTNLKHTANREKAENIYYMLHSRIPF